MDKTCILIQTCDKYDFLWEGLALSWKHNWNWSKFPIHAVVLTEEKRFPSPFSTIKGLHKELGAKNFSTRLISALQMLKMMGYERVIYSQDDFWPNSIPDSAYIEEISKFLDREDVDCVHMNEYRTWYEYSLEETEHRILDKKIKKFAKGSRFYYNHQLAWWKIDSLLAIQSPGEEPYENECNGTERAWETGSNCFFLNYPWYKPEYIHHKGTLLDSAYKIINELKHQDNWENI